MLPIDLVLGNAATSAATHGVSMNAVFVIAVVLSSFYSRTCFAAWAILVLVLRWAVAAVTGFAFASSASRCFRRAMALFQLTLAAFFFSCLALSSRWR